jgi:ferredoxin-NADP reductase
VTALASARPAATWAPPLPLDKDAALDRFVRVSGLTSLGRLTGLWAADLLLIQVLLMSRLPPLGKIVLAGAGVGITPLRALAEGLEYAPGEAILLQRYTAEPLFTRELEILAAEKGLQIVQLPGPRRTPSSVLGPAASGLPELTGLRRWIPDLAERDVFVCGPSAWTDGVERLALAAGVPGARIHSESFGW